jgi:hypothetical protein
MPGSFAFGGPDGSSLTPDHRRLLVCVTLSALVLAVGIATINVSLRLDFSRLLPAVLQVTLRDAVKPDPKPAVAEAPDVPPLEEAAQPAAAVAAEPTSLPATEPGAETVAPTAGAQPVDWYDVLERAAAEIVAQHAEIDSLHPEFDELRRIAAERYAPAQGGGPTPIQEGVERDIYGRTLLRRGNCFQVLDDTNVGNRYAFETFERHLWQCGFAFGRKRGQNLPWVEPIREKYNHLRDPDGSRSVPGAPGHPPGNQPPPGR